MRSCAATESISFPRGITLSHNHDGLQLLRLQIGERVGVSWRTNQGVARVNRITDQKRNAMIISVYFAGSCCPVGDSAKKCRALAIHSSQHT